MTDELQDALPRTAREIHEGISRRLHRGVQVSVSLAGSVVAEGAIGTSHEDVPLTSDTLLPWLSAGKPLTAVCVLRLLEAERLTLETPVAEVVPEFCRSSNDVTLKHLLVHTAGLQPVPIGWPHTSWNDVICTICEAGLEQGWIPGERAAYDPMRSWFLLGEIIRRLDGRPVEQVVRQDVMLPIGMVDSWMALSADQSHLYGDRIGRTYDVKGREQQQTDSHSAVSCGSPSPGASCRGPIRELRSFYEMLLAGGVTAGGDRLLQPSSVNLMTQRQREGMYDETFRHKLDFGLGVIVNSRRYGADTVPYGFGNCASEQTFGHGGARSCIAFADPLNQLVVCLAANGSPSEPQHQQRMRRLLGALNADIGLGIT